MDRRMTEERNRPVRVTAWIMGILFAGLLLYFIWFLIFGRTAVFERPENNRFDTAENKVIRGEIVTSDGAKIAYTEPGDTNKGDVRIYPYQFLFAPVTGYTAMGKTGLEATYHATLMTSGQNTLELIKNDLTGTRPAGQRLVTTLDSDLQYFCYNLLDGHSGSITVMEPESGRILAMVSRPTFDPNTVAEEWGTLTSEENDTGNLLNRATQGIYAPGSTFKIVTAIEYMREHPDDYQDFRFVCTGSYTDADGNVVHCSDGNAHGEVDLKHAIAHSCNCAFVKISEELDLEAYRELCEELGFQKSIFTDLPAKRSTVTIGREMSAFELGQTAFGQGNTLETPLQNLMITAMAANGGRLMRPQLYERTESADGNVRESMKPEEIGTILTEDQASYLNDALIAVVNEGTTPQAKSDYCQTAGKSGSAQYSAGLKDLHAWFTGYAPAEKPVIAVTVMLEKGGHGSPDAAPVFKQIIDYYFSR